MKSIITVTQLNRYIKDIIDAEEILKNIFIVGEISNFRLYNQSGHMYFTLKDEKSQLKAVMFSSYAARLKFMPENGMKVICRGKISTYERDGVYQLCAEDMQPDGLGSLNLAFEQLKEKLLKEGLFDDVHKKPIPKYPTKIGVATSNSGAAVEDIKNITKRRYPLAEIVIAPTIVQGELAVNDIVNSLKILDSMEDIDVIILGRGGGSMEDLWAFNSQTVARAIFECKTPVISAVGHETDFTISDFVADLRAPTPSAAAEFCVPDSSELVKKLQYLKASLKNSLINKVQNENQRLDNLINNSLLANPSEYYASYEDDIKAYISDLLLLINEKTDNCSMIFSSLCAKLDALSPLAVLGRGYCIAKSNNDNIIRRVKNITENDNIKLQFSDGYADCTVKEVRYEQ